MTGIPDERLRRLGRHYRIIREIGAGGTATVYVADDLRHGRSVAIKVLRPELAATVGPDRFLREIEIAARLTHPNILPLHDSGSADGLLFYVMPFIEGESLRHRMDREGALPVGDAARLFREIVDALGAAHEHGVIHRDVKPDNVLVAQGHALVADFGVAKALDAAAGDRPATTLGVALGTPRYMAPEQAAADPGTDHRADLFAAGVLLYEMLTGVNPFAGSSTSATIAALMTRDVEPPSRLRADVPSGLSDVVMRCLAKDPDERPGSASEVLALLDGATASSGPAPGAARPGSSAHEERWRPVRLAAIGAALLAFGLIGWRIAARSAEVRWARSEALPEVLRLADEGQAREAATLAVRVEEVIGSDPLLETIWPRVTSPFRVFSEPEGATVSYRPYAASDTTWTRVGTTPFETDRFPVGVHRIRVELEGYRPVEVGRSLIPEAWLSVLRSSGFDYVDDPSYRVEVELTAADEGPEGMIRVGGGTYFTVPVVGFAHVEPVEVPAFWLDRTEVTNADYRAFVDAGAYADPTLWPEPFVRDGAPVPWPEAMLELRDETGRPGPATWILGRPPEGRGDYPVGGLSWYEASAYCAWRGASLPTLFHWARAAIPSADSWAPFHDALTAASNIDAEGPLPVGTRDGVGTAGTVDMAGNVREWVSTAAGASRHLAGGAWNDPEYAVRDQVLASPWTRLPTDGVRCARFDEGSVPEELLREIDLPEQRLSGFEAMPDDIFQASSALYAYDRSQPLSARIDSTLPPVDGTEVQWVSVDVPYGGRLPMRVHVPVDAEPPFGAVIFFPGSDLFYSSEMGEPQLDFLPRAGWILVEPVWEGGYQRNDGRTLQRLGSLAERSVLFSRWVQDLGRVIDYLERRPDVAPGAVAYSGLSVGSSAAVRLLPHEPRIRAAILISGGMSPRATQEALDEQGGLAGRVRVPLLMLGGRHDFANPVGHQEALFDAFGTPGDQKRMRVYDAAHWPLPRSEVIRETVDFLARYVAPDGDDGPPGG